ncbi:MAG: SUMF1/EgtB/PvdO family nonheme iron enzyme [Magnetococcus sp. MYC-9]
MANTHIPIVLIDMEGFSRLGEAAEQRAVLLRLDRVLETALKPFTGYANPRTAVDWHGTGDGYYIAMGSYPSTVAMRFAVDLEKTLGGENARHPDFPLRLRIGLCLGDVEWVGRQQLSRAYTEAARLVDHPWAREVLKQRKEHATVLVTSKLFMDDWRSCSDGMEEALAIPSDPPWVRAEFPIKNNETLTGYVRVDQALFNAVQAGLLLNLAPAATTVDLIPWLESLLDRTGTLEIRGIGSAAGRQRDAGKYPIEQLYTPLRSQGGLDAAMREEQKTVSLAELLPRHRRLLIEGQPGAGKTTFLKLVAAMLAKDLLRIPNPQGGSWRQQYLGMQEAVRYPLFLRLSELAVLLAADTRPTADDRRRLLDLLAASPNSQEDPAWRRHWETLLREGGAMLLLDGLDEVADEGVRTRVIRIVQDAARHWQNGPIVVTSRPFGVEQMKGLGFYHAVIDPFGPEEIGTFISLWSAALHAPGDVGHDAGGATTHRQILLQAIADRPAIRRLAANPVMLTCLCVVHWNEGKLPEGRARVYQAVVRWLIGARTGKRSAAGYTDPFAEEALATLALAMMKGGKRGKQAVFDKEEGTEAVAALVAQHFQSFATKPRQLERARQWLAFECQGSGIVEELGDRRLKFWHLTFQEFLAALALAGMGDGETPGEDWWPEVQPFLDHPQWQESISLLPGTLLDKGGRRRVDCLLERVLAMGGETPDLPMQARIAGIMGRLLEPMSAYQYPVPQTIERNHQTILHSALAIFTREGAKRVSIQTRIAAAEALGRAGDPRLTKLNLLEVPETGGWSLGKYPVTVVEYSAFVEQGGYQDARWWCKAGWAIREEKNWENPDGWEDQTLHPNHPVTGVSWFEATAYCRWLSEREKRIIRLPVETLWAKAAGQGIYPWGEANPTHELANFGRNVGAPTPVGLYPAGDGPQGHCDLAGNVWEWQRNLYGDTGTADIPTDPAVAAGDTPVWRGGSWLNPAGDLRAAYRGYLAGSRGAGLGFRVAAAPSSTLEY